MQTTKSKVGVVSAIEGKPLSILGHQVTLKLASSDTGGASYVFEAISPPGAGVPAHVHQHEDEVIYVLDGEFEVFFNGQTQKATTGATLNFVRGIPHGFKNIGETPGKTLWVVTPGEQFGKFFDELAALPSNQPPDMAKVVAIFGKYGMQILA